MRDITKYVSVAYRRTQIFYSEKLKDLGITSGQFMYIVYICENPGQTQDEISQNLLIDKSTVAKVLSQLDESGHVVKQVDAFDRRAFNIYPTEQSKSIYERILEIKAEWHAKMTEDLSELERDIFEKLIEKVMNNTLKYAK